MKAKTYEDWKLLGYHVIKGEKSSKKDSSGIPLFERSQVEESWDDESKET